MPSSGRPMTTRARTSTRHRSPVGWRSAGWKREDAYTLSADPFSTFDGARNIQATGVGRRLDYILHRRNLLTPRCIQHLAMKRDFQTEFGSGSSESVNTDLSDHYAVSALIGPVTPYCAPHLARQITSDWRLPAGNRPARCGAVAPF